jgi:hypothetical protein
MVIKVTVRLRQHLCPRRSRLRRGLRSKAVRMAIKVTARLRQRL